MLKVSRSGDKFTEMATRFSRPGDKWAKLAALGCSCGGRAGMRSNNV